MSEITCSNCGATFDEMEPKCPFCGYISYKGAEEKFMDDLEEIQDNLSSLSSISEQQYKKEMSKQKKIILCTMIFLLVIICIIGIIYFVSQKMERTYFEKYDVKEEMIWERSIYPKLEALYKEELYDIIVECEHRLYSTENNHSFYNWKHYFFLGAYEKYKETIDAFYYKDMGLDISKHECENLVYNCMWYHFDQFDLHTESYTDEEYEQILQYKDVIEDIFYNRLKFTDEEANDLYQKCNENGYIGSKECYKYADKIYRRFE